MKRIKEEQNELFEYEDVIKVDDAIVSQSMRSLQSQGQQMADGVSDKIFYTAYNMIKRAAGENNFNLDAKAREHDMDVVDYIQDSDYFHELVVDLSQAYVEGINQAWPYPLGIE